MRNGTSTNYWFSKQNLIAVFRNIFFRSLRKYLLQILRRMPFSCKLIGIPIKRIPVGETENYFRRSNEPDTYFRKFPSENLWIRPAEYINSTNLKTPKEYTGKNFIMSLAKARYCHIHPSVITSECYQLAIVSNHPNVSQENHAFFNKLILPRAKKINGVCLLLSTANDNNYYHCLFQIAPKIWQLQKHGYDIEKIDHFVLEKSQANFQKEILDKLYINREKVIDIKSKKCVQARQLLLTPSYWKPELWICDGIKELFSRKDNSNESPSKIYISRNNAQFRRLLNEKEFMNMLGQFGFELIYTEGKSIQEQANLFAHAEVVVSPHGAALSNIVFCNPKTIIIELRGSNHYTDLGQVFEQVSSLCQLQHYTYLCEEIGNVHGSKAKFKDLKVNIREIEEFLEGTALKQTI